MLLRPLSLRLLHPCHIKEVEESLRRLDDNNEGSVRTTGMGLALSAGLVDVGRIQLRHYALSSTSPRWTARAARTIAKLILQLRHPAGDGQLIKGRDNIYHLLVPI
jgi:hypothetical protein